MRNSILLLVEDDPIEVLAMQRCVRQHKLPVDLIHAGDGEQGLLAVRRLCGVSDPLPLLVLLDINMPRMNGFEFLDALRSGDCHADAPVFILSTSNDTRDRRSAYARHVAGYICKDRLSADYADLANLVRSYCRLVTPPEPCPIAA